MSPTTSTRTTASQASSSTITIAPRPLLRPVKKAAKPIKPRVQIDILPLHTTVSGLDDSEISPLTPTSSPLERRDVQEFPRLSPEPIPTASSSQSKKSVKTASPRKRTSKSGVLDTWDPIKLGSRVWVLIDYCGRVLELDDLGETESQKDWIWWPGKVTSAKHTTRPLRVALANPSGFNVKTVEISDPCESNIVSWLNPAGRIRYEDPVVANHNSLSNVHASPRKKQKVDKGDLKRQWRLAVEELNGTASNQPPPSPKKPSAFSTKGVETPHPFPALDDGYDSDLPEVGTEEFRTYPPSAPSSPVKGASAPIFSQRKKRKRNSSLGPIEVVAPKWSPRPPDISITIPGELILATERASDSLYWPARVLDYLPADKPTKPDKYYVEFLDGKMQCIPRRWFHIAEDDDFATCKLGEWDSTVVEVRNDDEDNPLEQDSEAERFPSPLPTIPPPSAGDFKLLSIREQFAYAKPVLSAILNENFSPAMQRHNDFIVGGSKRKRVVEEAGLRGQMDPCDVDALQRYVTEWCLRDEQRAQVITDEEDISVPLSQDRLELNDHVPLSVDRSVSPTPTEILSEAELPPTSSFATSVEDTPSITHIDVSTSLLRQYGCEAFEALSRSEKNDYCLNVLLPETILQILLWRTGERTSPDLLGDAEEATLHAKGLELLRASDWVNDVMRLRMAAIGQLGKSKRNGARAKEGEILYSVTGRPRRSVGAPKSYLK
ncbi:hypothetical protein C0995_011010 [Termitomyces sp. Mi166|nr:hypothetical protein C0995_011010 [Termitomyces sp. Mi166\